MTQPTDIYNRQRCYAHARILAEGGFLMRMPFDLRLALFEDTNVYCADIIEHMFGPSVHVSVNGYQIDYFPALTYERAEQKAAIV